MVFYINCKLCKYSIGMGSSKELVGSDMSYPCAKVGGRRTNRVPCSGVHAGSVSHEARRTSCKYSIGRGSS